MKPSKFNTNSKQNNHNENENVKKFVENIETLSMIVSKVNKSSAYVSKWSVVTWFRQIIPI